jgi:hypothetical protein
MKPDYVNRKTGGEFAALAGSATLRGKRVELEDEGIGTIVGESERHVDVLMDGEGAKIWVVRKDDLIPVAKSPNSV